MQRCKTPEMTKCLCLYDEQNMPTIISCDKIHLDAVDIPQTVQNFSFTGGKIQTLSKDFIKQCRGDGTQLPKLTALDLSQNRIRTINANIFHCLSKLKTLRLNRNDLVVHNNSNNLFGNLEELRELHLEQAFHYPDHTFVNGAGKLEKQRVPEVKNATDITRLFQKSYMPNLHILHLERNQIWFLGSRAFCGERGPSSLRQLYLSHNSLGKPDLDHECLPYLKELYLNNNSMSRLTVSFIDHLNNMTNLSMLNISNNPWLCDCHFNNTLQWILYAKGRYVLNGNSSTLRCGFQDDKGKFIKDLHSADLICQDPESLERRLRNSYIVLGCVFGAVGILFLIVIYMNRAKIVKICKRFKESCVADNSHHGYSLAV